MAVPPDEMDVPPDEVEAVDHHDPAPPSLAARPLTEPHAARLSPDDPLFTEIVRVHAEALAAGADTYTDPRTGYTVLTAGYLARRGTCCDSGCRHCPYLS